MNLPLFIDISVGLIFIFLTLSLLASELQELIATLLQWRAEHLKRSIELLLSGETSDHLPGIAYANRLYQHPLICTLNQEAKGPIAKACRTLSQAIGQSYRALTGTRNVFGRFKSGPSYIPSESFAEAMLSDLNLKEISRRRSWDQLLAYRTAQLRLIQDLLQALRRCMGDRSLLVLEFDELNSRLQSIGDDLSRQRLDYSTAIDQTHQMLLDFLSTTESVFENQDSCRDVIQRQVPYLRQAIARLQAEPTLLEIMEQALNTLENQNFVPEQVKHTLRSLALNSQTQSSSLLDGVNHLEKAVGTWFDRSMERASGVYRRNAKGVALLIGLFIAISTNTDTLYVVQHLSKDSTLRTTLTQAADQVRFAAESAVLEEMTTESTESASASRQLRAIRDAVDENLDQLPLPIGWHPVIVGKQENQASAWRIPLLLRRFLGWLVTAIAISMGASFWYGILNKALNVRNTGGNASDESQK